MPINTNKTRQKVLYVYATEYDVKHPTILRMAYTSGRYRDWETDRKSTRLNSSHSAKSRMPSSA